MNERVANPLAITELERRWRAIREAMEHAGVDVVLAQANNDFHGGTVRYLTDIPATSGVWMSVVFPRDDVMTVVTLGPEGGEIEPGGDVWRGARVRFGPTFAAASYTSIFETRQVVTALRPWARGTIGLLGPYQLSAALVDAVRTELPGATLVDATDILDAIRVIKSPYEQTLIRGTAALQDKAMEAAFAAVEPGVRESEITAVAQHVCSDLGAEQGIYLSASFPNGEPLGIAPRHFQNRILREGDTLCLLVESNGPGGFYAELGRTIVLGTPPDRLVEELAFTRAAQRFCLDLLEPGTRCSEIWVAYNEFMRENGRPEERRLHAHGQGHDLVERPLVRLEEQMRVAEGMSIVVHPTHIKDGVTSWICDNYLVGAGGPGPSLHGFPQEIATL
jgi:Xaa-Pro aminopeptidase